MRAINRAHLEHSLDLFDCAEHELHGRARKHAQAAWRAAGGPDDGFASWWEIRAGSLAFDSLKALVGLAWEDACRAVGKQMVDAEFHAWWDSISGQNTLAAHHPDLAKAK